MNTKKLRGTKPLLYSDEVDHIISENLRAKLISQIIDAEEGAPREFASYFHGPRNNVHDPSYLVTSHTTSPIQRRRPVIPAYQSVVQALRWSPYVDVSSIEDSQSDANEPKFRCKCRNCQRPSCPAKRASSAALKRCKDNIMTFCDRHTMTPRLNDACCGGYTPVPSTPKTSDMSVTASSVAVRCTQDGYCFPQGYSPRRCAPAPILKKSDMSLCRDYRKEPLCIRHEAVRDTDVIECREPIRSRSIRSFICPRKKSREEVHICSHRERSRKVLYNEGISDHIAEKYPVPPPVRPPSPKNLKCERSKVSLKSRCFIADKNKCFVQTDNAVPYSHRGESKYHHKCKKSVSKQMTSDSDSEEVRHVVASPKIVRKCHHSRSNKRYRTPSIKFPRKVLTSERDIEAFIERSQIVLTPPEARCPKSKS